MEMPAAGVCPGAGGAEGGVEDSCGAAVGWGSAAGCRRSPIRAPIGQVQASPASARAASASDLRDVVALMPPLRRTFGLYHPEQGGPCRLLVLALVFWPAGRLPTQLGSHAAPITAASSLVECCDFGGADAELVCQPFGHALILALAALRLALLAALLVSFLLALGLTIRADNKVLFQCALFLTLFSKLCPELLQACLQHGLPVAALARQPLGLADLPPRGAIRHGGQGIVQTDPT